jgi:hypothetical protein
MKESCCQFGPERQLAGIITEPSGRAARFGFVLVSAGITPKHGPFRLYAELARRLAEEGITTLRFDLGGIGDSAPSSLQAPLKQRTELELRAAVDYLAEQRGLDALALGGLCSGAEDAFRGAAVDGRVRAVVLIDPFAYRTPGWAWRHALYRLRRRTLRALGLYAPAIATQPPAELAADKRTKLVAYKYMAQAESTRILSGLLRRRGRAHFVYTGGMRDLFNHEHQLRAMFGDLELGSSVTLDYFPHLDHTQLLAEDRRALTEAIARRLSETAGIEERARAKGDL